MVSLLSKLLLVGAAAVPAQAQAMAAWWSGIGPQLLVHNATTNQLRYSACNAYDEPVYSYTDGSVLSIFHKPRVGTPVAGVGWWNNKFTQASIFFISDQGSIINALFNCNMATGQFVSQGEWIISGDSPSIHNNSGLASIVLGSTTGYRVFYHDSDGAINEISYTTATDWQHHGIISQDINSLPGLAATFSGSNNITVVSPRDDQNIAATRWRSGGVWERTTFPHPLDGSLITDSTNRTDILVNKTAASLFSLPAWDGKTQSLGISLDSTSTRTVWYLGNDSNLYSVANQNFTWSVRANQSTAFWPKADTPNGQIAVAADQTSSMVRIYYVVKGLISEVTYENGGWKSWSAVATPTAQLTTSATPSATNLAAADTAESGLSTGAKAGVGVGVSLGAIALGAIIAVVVLARRKKQQGFEQPPYADEGSTTVGPDTPAMSYGSPTTLAHSTAATVYEPYGWEQKNHSMADTSPRREHMQVHQLDGTHAPTELYARPLYELANHSDTHELGANVPQAGR